MALKFAKLLKDPTRKLGGRRQPPVFNYLRLFSREDNFTTLHPLFAFFGRLSGFDGVPKVLFSPKQLQEVTYVMLLPGCVFSSIRNS